MTTGSRTGSTGGIPSTSSITSTTTTSRPQLPLDCCMSGCKTCVYDIYYSQVEEWNNLNPKDQIVLDAGLDAFSKMERELKKNNIK